jgi:hypothetical protein
VPHPLPPSPPRMPAVQYLVVRARSPAVSVQRAGARTFHIVERGARLAELVLERDGLRVSAPAGEVAVRARAPLAAHAFFSDVVVEEAGRGVRSVLYAAGPDGETCAAVVAALLEVLSHLPA